MELNINSGGSRRAELKEALLLYSINGEITAATSHEIKYSSRRRRHELQEGVPLDMPLLKRMISRMADGQKEPDFELFPHNLLAYRTGAMVWHVVPKPRKIYFATTDKELNKRSGRLVMYPDLVFAASGSRLGVYAVHPVQDWTASIKLYRAPVMNVFFGGNICMPGEMANVRPVIGNMAEYERLFFDSPYSHAHDSTVHYKGGLVKFWLKQTKNDKKPADFPLEVLVDANKTLGGLLNEIGQA